ncbi:trypsin-like peptidase domain-containing protein [Streptantibioticus ferralitis]|uniref:Trypsin-like peptidase domain-containing protein n=1 Tax=Streptantibioticus ferralitis TaxID=236510 RepID=A0ABT5YSU8_9ACTN|nr:trypsin-like peptidase domain-containing protein [Streptantibioticus ferralitis]MDF2254676.1 trypsin-like peptidase domain-containing protein [Streptantibioticus ferralitis]
MDEGKAARPHWWSRPRGDGAKGPTPRSQEAADPTPQPSATGPDAPAPAPRTEQSTADRPEPPKPPAPGAEAVPEESAAPADAPPAAEPGPSLAKGEPGGTVSPAGAAETAASTGPAAPTDSPAVPASGAAPADQPHPHGPAPEVPPSEPVAGNPYATPAHGVSVGPVAAAGPQHPADPYGTPPYGRPGPWAPAPPVQHPAAPPPVAPPPSADPVHTGQGGWHRYDPWAPPVPPAPAGPGAPKRRGRLVVAAVLVALLAGAFGGITGAYLERRGTGTAVSLPQAPADHGGRAPGTVAGIAAATLPGVVYIHVMGNSEEGTGTGFVLDADGHILTNNHVVAPAASSGDISVTLSGGGVHKATIVGRDTGDDLAVIKVSGVSGLKPLTLGNSESVRVGDPVVAIGAPYDLEGTVTSGIISAKDRPITAGGGSAGSSDVSYVNALQTDAPINPGNSGGPLVNSQGQVIGINSAIRSSGNGSPDGAASQGGSIGLGFAIPINQAKRVAEELINTGKATHPVIGVTVDMRYNGDGARIADKGTNGAPAVTPGGPGANAGLKPGDVVTQVDGQPVHTGAELIVRTRSHRPGDHVQLTVKSGDAAPRTVDLVLGGSTSG